MKRLAVVLMAFGLVIGSIGLTWAATVTLTPGDLTGDPRPGSQTPPAFTGKYAWDWDADKPIGSTTVGGAAGFGASSWYSDVAGSLAGTGRDYTTFRFFPENIFSEIITVNELKDVTYWSNWVGGDVDWTLRIYTKPSGSSWFGQRANFYRGNLKDSTWHFWSAASLGVEWLQNRNVSPWQNAYGKGWVDFLTAAGSEEIMMNDIGASYATNSPPSYTYLDGVTISLADGRSQSMDLAVPEPATLMLLGFGLIGVAAAGRKA